MRLPARRLPLLALGIASSCAAVSTAPPPTRVIEYDEVPELVVEKPPPRAKVEREYDEDIWFRAYGVGESLVAIPVAGESASGSIPRCVFGTDADGPGSIWFLTADGVDPDSFTPGPEHGELSRFGFALRLAGDHDDDGVPDLWVSAPGRLEDPGKVFLVSTLARQVLCVLSSPRPQMRFGTALCPVEDQDGDGEEDVAVLAEEQGPGGRYDALITVYVFSTSIGEVLRAVIEGLDGSAYGRSQLAWIPMGEEASSGLLSVGPHGAEPDRLIAIHLPSGDRAWTLVEESRLENTAWALDTTPDRDGDGVPELLVGDLGWGEDCYGGRARVVSGRTGEVLCSTAGMWASHDSGFSVAGCDDDHDGDGVPDFVVTDEQGPVFDGGSLLILSGADGSPLKRLTVSGGFWSVGRTLDVGADWDGKGLRDVCFSSWVPTAGGIDTAGAIGVVSVEEGKLLHHVLREDLGELIRQREGR